MFNRYKIITLVLFLLTENLLSNSYSDKILNDSLLQSIIFIFIIFLILLIYFIFYKKARKSKKNIINNSIADYKYMDNMILNINNSYNKFLGNKDNKNIEKYISNSLKELLIFLDIKSENIYLHRENFNLEQFITEITQKISTKKKELNVVAKNDISYSIITDKNILTDIFMLLSLLQFKEHNLKYARINLEIKTKENKLILSIDEGLSYNKHMKKVLEDSTLTPYYNEKEHFYYGLYLFLINKILKEVNGVLTIEILEKVYNLSIEIPISIEQQDKKNNILMPKHTKEQIEALIICDDESLAKSISNFLKFYNINSKTITNNYVVQIPNFIEYDLLFANANFLNSIFAEYLTSIKKYHTIKIVAVEGQENSNKYKNSLVDEVLKKPIIKSKIYDIVIKLFNKLENETSIIRDKKENLEKSNRNKKVLIADDNLINRNLLKAMIESYGLSVITASDGEEALEELEKNSDIKLVILDSIMPKLDAYETIKKIRSNEKYNTIPVIIHSSFSFNGKTSSIDELFKLGFDSYLPKPFNIEKLESILLRYLNVEPIANVKESDKLKEYEEFIAIYGNSDKMIEKYVKENSLEQLETLLKDLKNISSKIEKENLYNEVELILEEIKDNKKLTVDTIEPLIKEITITKYEIINKLNS